MVSYKLFGLQVLALVTRFVKIGEQSESYKSLSECIQGILVVCAILSLSRNEVMRFGARMFGTAMARYDCVTLHDKKRHMGAGRCQHHGSFVFSIGKPLHANRAINEIRRRRWAY